MKAVAGDSRLTYASIKTQMQILKSIYIYI